MSFDFIIVGGGPCGLTLALYLSEKFKVLLIDKNNKLGGCHRVFRETNEQLFSEHGPRMYSSSYVNFKKHILPKINTSWEECFTKSFFDISNIGGYSLNSFSLREKMILFKNFLKLVFFMEKDLKYKSVEEFYLENNFSQESKDFMERLCRLTDGAGGDRYTLYEFFQLLNQNFFYNLYQPKFPNDEFLFALWEEKLKEKGVVFFKNREVEQINEKEKYLLFKNSNQKIYFTKKLFLCIPPKPLVKIVEKNERLYELFSQMNNFDLRKWAENNSYNDYISITFHWKDKIVYDNKKWGFPRNEWGIAYIALTEYMKPEEDYKTLISSCITFGETKSKATGKTAFEMIEMNDTDGVVEETFRQLSESLNINVKYDRAIIRKKGEDTAFVETKSQQFFKNYSCCDDSIYYIGTQNGNSYYRFTSMESAVTNALTCLKDLGFNVEINRPFELVFLIRIKLIITILLIILILKLKQ